MLDDRKILPRDAGPEDVCQRCGLADDARARLETYVEALNRWNAHINLVAPSTLPEVWVRHVADGLQLLPPLRQRGMRQVIDLGSGGGVPGLVLALAEPALDVHLVESTARKCAFLRQVAQACGIDVNIHQQRIEALDAQALCAGPRTAVTARALASLPRLLDLAAPLLERGAQAFFLKGRQARMELEEARRSGWRFDSEMKPSITDTEGAILMLREVRRG